MPNAIPTSNRAKHLVGHDLVLAVALAHAKVVSNEKRASLATAPSLDGVRFSAVSRMVERRQEEDSRPVSRQEVIEDLCLVNLNGTLLAYLHLRGGHRGQGSTDPAQPDGKGCKITRTATPCISKPPQI